MRPIEHPTEQVAGQELPVSDPNHELPSSPSAARVRANRLNAKKSTGPRTPSGKQRSSLNATRHGVLSQVIHLPEEEMKVYSEFCDRFVSSLQPVGALESELAHACADLQFRLHRLAAAEHNLFAIGHHENAATWNSPNAESHSAIVLAETLRQSNPLITLTIYEQRLSRRLLQTLKQLREIQAERRETEQSQLRELARIAAEYPDEIENIQPERLGFVCSNRDWSFHLKRSLLLNTGLHRVNAREILCRTA